MPDAPVIEDDDIEGTEEARRRFKEKMAEWRREGVPFVIPSNFRAVRQ